MSLQLEADAETLRKLTENEDAAGVDALENLRKVKLLATTATLPSQQKGATEEASPAADLSNQVSAAQENGRDTDAPNDDEEGKDSMSANDADGSELSGQEDESREVQKERHTKVLSASTPPYYTEQDDYVDDNQQTRGDRGDMNNDEGDKFDFLAKAMFKMQEQVAAMASRLGPAGGLPTTQHIKSEHVKTEPIDLVSSSSDSDSDEDDDATEKSMSVPERKKLAERPKIDPPKVTPSHANHSGVDSAAPAPRQRTNTKGTAIRTPSYTQSQQRRDVSIRNWHDGMRRQATKERIKNEILESTADNLPQILANMRVTGFGVIKNFKKLAMKSAFDMDDSSSHENESSSEPRRKCVFAEGNLPDSAQAYYHETAGWNTTGTAKPPKHDILFEGVTINSRDYDFKTRMSKLESDDKSGRVARHVMAAKSKALAAYNEKYEGQMQDIIRGMFANERITNGCDPANPDN